MTDQPSIEQSRELYASLMQFLKQEPWTILRDSDVFGVTDPSSGQEVYCSVLGNSGIVTGLVLYRGARGYSYLQTAASGTFDVHEALALQDCLTLTFGAKKELDKSEIALIEELGYSENFARRWPFIRNSEPYLVPEQLSGQETALMVLCIGQVLDLYSRLRSGKLTRESLNSADGQLMMREATTEPASGQIIWNERLVKPLLPHPAPLPPITVDDITRKRIERRPIRKTVIWEIDTFPFPGAVKERSRAYFPVAVLAMDSSSGMVAGNEILPPGDDLEIEIGLAVLSMIAGSPHAPSMCLFQKQRLFALLSPVLGQLGIRTRLEDSLQRVQEFQVAFLSDTFAKKSDH